MTIDETFDALGSAGWCRKGLRGSPEFLFRVFEPVDPPGVPFRLHMLMIRIAMNLDDILLCDQIYRFFNGVPDDIRTAIDSILDRAKSVKDFQDKATLLMPFAMANLKK